MFRYKFFYGILIAIPGIVLAVLGAKTAFQENPKNQERIDFLKSQIKQIESQLSSYNSNKDNFIQLIQARQGLLKNRNLLIDKLNDEIVLLTQELKELDLKNTQSLATLNQYKSDYEFAARRKFIHRVSQSAVVLADHAQWKEQLKRLIWKEQWNNSYIERYQLYRKSLETILLRKQEIEKKLIIQSELVNVQESEKQKAQSDLDLLNKDYLEIKNKIKEFQRTLDKYNREMSKLEKLIHKSITEDKRNKVESNTKNIGKWNFPLSGGYIVSPFGVFKDSKNKQLVLRNNGVDIRSKESFVQSVTDAYVVQIRQMDKGRFFILTKSGGYYQVYSNLDKVFVKVGENIQRSINIGELSIDKQGNYSLHFEVWKDRTPVDPISFIGR
ncbi:MAG: peptidoglycan DD-metalloendopeptidase family protein [Saprospiraceae bacterium]|nr:peptidoglycan DD-metalloendopeptidase family protein [Saprospiraceae bacterium]